MTNLNPHGEAYYNGNPFKDAHITIIGIGAVGSWLAMSLAKQGATLTLVDFDTVEDRNLGTTVFTEMELGMPKVEAMQALIFNQVERTRNWTVTAKNIGSTVTAKTDILIDCTDNAAARNLIQDLGPVPVLHVGINAHYGSAVWDRDFGVAVDPDEPDACDVPYSLNLIMPLVGLTVDMLAEFFTTQRTQSFGFDLVAGQKIKIT